MRKRWRDRKGETERRGKGARRIQQNGKQMGRKEQRETDI